MSQKFVMIKGVHELLIGPKQVFLSLPAKKVNNNKFSSQIIVTYTVGSWSIEIAKKVFVTFDNVFHVYLMRGFQKYARN